MCRLLGYLGKSIELDKILYEPEHSLIVQSYQPKEMEEALLNADGFGVGWYDDRKIADPYRYRNIQPIWSDLNLPNLSRYVRSQCVLSYVRSATPGLAVDLSNCQPFTRDRILFIHNGYIKNFRKTLYRSIRNCLADSTYELIQGTTDSEHIFALIIDRLQHHESHNLQLALRDALSKLTYFANSEIYFAANVMVSDGKQLVASRYASRSPAPTLYWLKDDPNYPESVIVASEPLFNGNWKSCPENSIISVGEDLEIRIDSIA